jgi:hypothetical protein
MLARLRPLFPAFLLAPQHRCFEPRLTVCEVLPCFVPHCKFSIAILLLSISSPMLTCTPSLVKFQTFPLTQSIIALDFEIPLLQSIPHTQP